ncbi:MAG: rhomboid family intramembrane serine protease [Bacteroidota bacterium]
MTREEHLHYCRVCGNKGFDPRKGLICTLTNEVAAFEGDCADFTGDREAIAKQKQQARAIKQKKPVPEFLKPFIPASAFFVTPILGLVNILVFLAMIIGGVHFFNPGIDSLIAWGANFKAETLENGYWRIITNFFIHIGFIHLLVNVYAMLFVGMYLERIIGWAKTLVAYLVSGIAGSVLSLWWYDTVVSAGASGAIFGLFGVYLALLLSPVEHKKMNKKSLPGIILFLVYNLLYGMQEGIDNAAHIGGLFSGILIGMAFIPSLNKDNANPMKWAPWVATSLAIPALCLILVIRMPNTVGQFTKVMEEYTAYEQSGLKIYQSLEHRPADNALYLINNQSIPSLERALLTLDKIDTIDDLPYHLIHRVNRMRDYVGLHIKHLGLISRAMETENEAFDFLIEETGQRISNLYAELMGITLDEELLPENDNESETPSEESVLANQENNASNGNPLYVVDGVPVGNELTIEPQNITSLTVLNDSVAVSVYGDKGRNGVVVVTTQ